MLVFNPSIFPGNFPVHFPIKFTAGSNIFVATNKVTASSAMNLPRAIYLRGNDRKINNRKIPVIQGRINWLVEEFRGGLERDSGKDRQRFAIIIILPGIAAHFAG